MVIGGGEGECGGGDGVGLGVGVCGGEDGVGDGSGGGMSLVFFFFFFLWHLGSGAWVSNEDGFFLLDAPFLEEERGGEGGGEGEGGGD